MEKKLQDQIRANGEQIKLMDQGLAKEAKETVIYAVEDLLKAQPESMIGHLEHMIRKITVHPERMEEIDFKAASTAQNLVHFLRLIDNQKRKKL